LTAVACAHFWTAVAAAFVAQRSIFAQFEFPSTEAISASEIVVDLVEADFALALFIRDPCSVSQLASPLAGNSWNKHGDHFN
jgi:hypothetical protein